MIAGCWFLTSQVSKAHVASWEEAEAVWQARMQEAVEEAQRESQERIADAQKEHRDVLERTAAQMREEWAEQEQRALTAQQREMALEKVREHTICGAQDARSYEGGRCG